MNKSFLFSISTIAVAILFSGCGKDVRIMRGSADVRSISVPQMPAATIAGTINSTNRSLFQASAEETLRAGYSNFYFVSPFEVSYGAIKNTDDFLSKCADKSTIAGFALGLSTLMLASSHDDCNIYNGDAYSSIAGIKMLHEKDKGIDALGVINALKEKKYYKELSTEYRSTTDFSVIE